MEETSVRKIVFIMNRKKIVILDSAGMMGHMIFYYLKSIDEYDVKGLEMEIDSNDDNLDLNSKVLIPIIKFIDAQQPDIVINTMRVLVKESSNNPDKAIYINSYLPKYLENKYKKTNTKIIHLSTDCVFSGEKGGYIESDTKDGKDIYAKTRGLGEIDNNKDLTIRTSYIGPVLGEKHEELFDWFLSQQGTVNGYINAFWTGVTTLELAKAIDATIDQNINGLIHITNGQPISKYELISLFKEIWKTKQITVKPVNGKPVDKSLKSERLDFNYKVPSYFKMLIDQFQWMKSCQDLYLNLNI